MGKGLRGMAVGSGASLIHDPWGTHRSPESETVDHSPQLSPDFWGILQMISKAPPCAMTAPQPNLPGP
jgi:hypothetical protein